MTTHIWVIEVYFIDEWVFQDAFPSRAVARSYRAANFFPGYARIRKYVPA